MMGHVWQRDGKLIIAAKGSAERILTICELTDEQRKEAEEKIDSLSSEGLRVIAIAAGYPQTENEVPASAALLCSDWSDLLILRVRASRMTLRFAPKQASVLL